MARTGDRVLGIVFALVLVVGLLPLASAFGDEEAADEGFVAVNDAQQDEAVEGDDDGDAPDVAAESDDAPDPAPAYLVDEPAAPEAGDPVDSAAVGNPSEPVVGEGAPMAIPAAVPGAVSLSNAVYSAAMQLLEIAETAEASGFELGSGLALAPEPEGSMAAAAGVSLSLGAVTAYSGSISVTVSGLPAIACKLQAYAFADGDTVSWGNGTFIGESAEFDSSGTHSISVSPANLREGDAVLVGLVAVSSPSALIAAAQAEIQAPTLREPSITLNTSAVTVLSTSLSVTCDIGDTSDVRTCSIYQFEGAFDRSSMTAANKLSTVVISTDDDGQAVSIPIPSGSLVAGRKLIVEFNTPNFIGGTSTISEYTGELTVYDAIDGVAVVNPTANADGTFKLVMSVQNATSDRSDYTYIWRHGATTVKTGAVWDGVAVDDLKNLSWLVSVPTSGVAGSTTLEEQYLRLNTPLWPGDATVDAQGGSGSVSASWSDIAVVTAENAVNPAPESYTVALLKKQANGSWNRVESKVVSKPSAIGPMAAAETWTSATFSNVEDGTYKVSVVPTNAAGNGAALESAEVVSQVAHYALTLNPNGAGASIIGTDPSGRDYVATDIVTLPSAERAATSEYTYEFLGWGASADAETAAYQAGDTVEMTEDRELWAVWKATAVVAPEPDPDPDPEPDPDPDPDPAIYAVTAGAWEKGSTEGLVVTGEGALADFEKLTVDGEEVAASNYTVAPGSTIATLSTVYLDTLSVGTHAVGMEWADGAGSGTFEVKAAAAIEPEGATEPTETNPPTTTTDSTGETATAADTTSANATAKAEPASTASTPARSSAVAKTGDPLALAIGACAALALAALVIARAARRRV